MSLLSTFFSFFYFCLVNYYFCPENITFVLGLAFVNIYNKYYQFCHSSMSIMKIRENLSTPFIFYPNTPPICLVFRLKSIFFTPQRSVLFFWKKYHFFEIFLKVSSFSRSVPKPLNQLSRRWVTKLMKPAS